MITGHVFIATSLDGFIARPDGGIDWLDAANAAGEDHGYDAFIAGIDGIVMGHATFRLAEGFDPWPYDKPVLVLSRSRDPSSLPPALAGRVALVTSVAFALAEAENRGWRRIYVDGGATIRAFLGAGAIHEMTITRIPVLLGDGLPLFGPLPCNVSHDPPDGLPRDLALRHVVTRSFPSGLVQSHYRVASG